MPRAERRVLDLTPENYRTAIPRNFRLVRHWTQAVAAEWYGCTERAWRRYEQRGAPVPLLIQIARWSRRTEAGAAHAHQLRYSP